ncbi:aspartate 1-decarboxylase [Candidatus Kaiserbacteria bacterium GWA2_50_9]|uniref:Aspartate 1-decarboxylase n=1 Tax=Candidatus Kaiserbacteria bacterium GWA2_50_9 TaxID=1798474 RepID=A0A1F6BX46_9BACT|nr:MAG: aspartate 1-decarboxylase [Candidatus Kaiserbacteria bacterium GWA2_50_9]
MLLETCLAKIHRATVTGADLDYVGSVTIDGLLIDAAGLLPGQSVLVNSLANGISWKTYIVRGEEGKGEIILNGPPAHHFKKGDMVIILAYVLVSEEEAKKMTHPKTVFVDGKNHITEVKKEWRPE